MTAGHHVADLGRHRQDSCYIPETRRKPDVPLATNIGFESRLLRQRVVANRELAPTLDPNGPADPGSGQAGSNGARTPLARPSPPVRPISVLPGISAEPGCLDAKEAEIFGLE
jgi:hypothetical protein